MKVKPDIVGTDFKPGRTSRLKTEFVPETKLTIVEAFCNHLCPAMLYTKPKLTLTWTFCGSFGSCGGSYCGSCSSYGVVVVVVTLQSLARWIIYVT